MKADGKIYESLSYNKDLLTGETFREKKKKRNKGIKGKVKLELFDAKTNKKVKEAYTENLIPDLYFKDTFINQFVNGIMGAGNTRSSYNYNWFNYLYLTDHDKPENVNEQRVMGNVIGYAHRDDTYSGKDAKRGTINKAETRFEVIDNRIKINFVFDFPTHAANGIIESIYWAENDLENKDYFYNGATLYGRENEDLDCNVDSSINPKRYWAIHIGFADATAIKFTSSTKGWVLLDCKRNSVTQSRYIEFPESLKGHWIMMPFDLNTNDIVFLDKAVCLLNTEGSPLVPYGRDEEGRKNDYLSDVCPYIQPDGNLIFIGYYAYPKSYKYYIRIYKWSKVGVQLSYMDVEISQAFKDVDYNTVFKCTDVINEGVYLDGCLDVIGYTYGEEAEFNQKIYTSRWIRVNAEGNVIQNMNIKPKIGNSTWFGSKAMNSGNIEKRARIDKIDRCKNRIYLYYEGQQGGSSFYQVITPQGNLLEPYREHFGFKDTGYIYHYNILGTDKWISRYKGPGNQLLIRGLLTSKPIGAHTKLAQPVEKTEANTMKIQYMFEIDLIDYGQDYY